MNFANDPCIIRKGRSVYGRTEKDGGGFNIR
jgi:hypothetical protein